MGRWRRSRLVLVKRPIHKRGQVPGKVEWLIQPLPIEEPIPPQKARGRYRKPKTIPRLTAEGEQA